MAKKAKLVARDVQKTKSGDKIIEIYSDGSMTVTEPFSFPKVTEEDNKKGK